MAFNGYAAATMLLSVHKIAMKY